MSFSTKSYVADGVTTNFNITFDYLDRQHIVVRVNKVELTNPLSTFEFEFVNDQAIRLTEIGSGDPVPFGDTVEIIRRTPIDEPAVVFRGGSSLSSENLNTNAQYLTFALQEATDADQEFTKLYLGPFSSSPVTDNDGDELIAGALYLDTTFGAIFYWSGTAWLPFSDASGAAVIARDEAQAAQLAAEAARDTALGTVLSAAALRDEALGFSQDAEASALQAEAAALSFADAADGLFEIDDPAEFRSLIGAASEEDIETTGWDLETVIPITSNLQYTEITHNLGSKPSKAEAVLRCTAPINGFEVGDEVEAVGDYTTVSRRAVSLVRGTTLLKVRWMSSFSLQVQSSDNLAEFTVSSSNFEVVVRARL